MDVGYIMDGIDKPVTVIVLRELSARWREHAEISGAAYAHVLEECADDLDALIAHVEPQEPEQENHDGSMQTVRWVGRNLPEGSSGDVSAMSRDRQGRPEIARMADAAEMLWVVLASVSGGDWMQQSSEWQEAAARWRDNYFAVLAAHRPEQEKPHVKTQRCSEFEITEAMIRY